MKKWILALLCIAALSACGKEAVVYESGMFTDVRDFDFYRDAVKLCVEEGYMDFEGDEFGAYEPVTLSECADIIVRITGAKTSNPMEYVVKKEIAPRDFLEWDAPATRETVAYMLARAVEYEEKNPVTDGAVSDAGESYAKEEIYKLYKMGIFSGDKTGGTFRPFENMMRSEMAIVVERITKPEKRASFDMSKIYISFVAFGDTIGHEPVLRAGKTMSGYDFTEFFENVKPYVDKADVACVNQETIFVENNFTGYPSFGSPEEFGIAEYEVGFDVVTHATNHAFDRGVGGILYTADFWKNYPDVEMLGIHETEEDAGKISVIKKKGVKIALLNYTYSLNGYRLPQGKGYMVDLLDEEKIKSDMEKARKISDAIVVFAHWGNEYQNVPCQSQKNWAQLFADNGATVIVGHHPHVVQPLEAVVSRDGRVVPVYYSLGNFISNQNDYQNALCAMADFKIVKDKDGVSCVDYKIEPIITHMESTYYSAYHLEEYPEDKLLRHKHRGRYGTRFTKEAYMETFNEIVA